MKDTLIDSMCIGALSHLEPLSPAQVDCGGEESAADVLSKALQCRWRPCRPCFGGCLAEFSMAVPGHELPSLHLTLARSGFLTRTEQPAGSVG